MTFLNRLFDFRQTKAIISNSAELAEYLRRPYDDGTGLDVSPAVSVRQGTVFACVRVLAESVGQLPLHLYKTVGRNKDKDTKHPLFRVLHGQTSPVHTSQEWLELVVTHLCLAGNHYSLINRGADNGRVLELLALNPDFVQPLVDPSDGYSLFYRVTFPNGKTASYSDHDILHIKGFSFDGLLGVSPLRVARETVGLAQATQRHAARMFRNGANPGGVLEVPDTLSETAYKRLKESWDEIHTGVNNAHRTAILEGGTKWAQVGLSAEDSQMLESRKFSRTEICGLFRVPPAMVGDLERATFANTEQQARSFVDFALAPWLTRIEMRIWMQLLNPKEQENRFARFNRNSLMGADAVTRSGFYRSQQQCGAMSPNEIRDMEDMNPREGGDVFLTPMNMLINGQLPPQPGVPPSEGNTTTDPQGDGVEPLPTSAEGVGA